MIEQRSDDWFKARLGKATASKFDDIMKGSKLAGWKNYRAELVIERLTGKQQETYTSAAMQWGTDSEPLARLFYTLMTGNEVEECGFFEHETLAAGASPDGLVGKDKTIEIKCPNPATHINTLRTGKVPAMYMAQVQGQMWVTGRARADFISFDPRLPENAKIIIIPVERDDDYIKLLEGRVTQFLQEVEAEVNFIQNYGRVKDDVDSKSSGEGASDSDVRVRGGKNVVRPAQIEAGIK